MVRIGNDVYDRWTSSSALAKPEQIVATIKPVDRSVVRTVGSQKDDAGPGHGTGAERRSRWIKAGNAASTQGNSA